MSGPRAAGASVVALVAIEVLAALAAYEGWSRIARAENLPASAPTESADAAADDSGPARQEPVASVALSGPVACALASAGEAITIWRHGRTARGPVDETTVRVRVAGGGVASERLSLGFSVGMLLPGLRPGSYASSRTRSAVAAVWARTERTASQPDIEWSFDGDEARSPGGITITLTSATLATQSSERQGDVTLDTSSFVVHGALRATAPCARSVATLRGICSPVTLAGTF